MGLTLSVLESYLERPIIVALDLGEKRVGVAATDPLGLTAQPVTVLNRKPHGPFMEAVNDLVKQRGATLVVLGLPKNSDGSMGAPAQRALSLAHELRTRFGLEVDTYDERLTTAMADRVFDQAGLSRAQRLKSIDKMAAAIILDGYLAFLERKRLETV
ncbi:MAG: Holliday junction resolvase RuvX [Deltaproteobacteria bacterium]|nr:Holliday junction resolvase RuvX [Deltaproteobacteria bacterium]